MLTRRQRGLYCVPGNLIVGEPPVISAVYVGLLRYTNMHNEIVTSIYFLEKYLATVPQDCKNGSNQRMRAALKRLTYLKVLDYNTYKSNRYNLGTCFVLKFRKEYGWGYRHSAQGFGLGYLKEAEVDTIREKYLATSHSFADPFPSLLHLVLYVRLFMERPAGFGSLKKIEENACCVMLEEQICEALNVSYKTLMRRLILLRRFKVFGFGVRYVRETPHSMQKRILLIVNQTPNVRRALKLADRSLREIFAEVRLMPDRESWLEADKEAIEIERQLTQEGS